VLLRVAPSREAHPIRALIDAGVPVTINTDDPAYFSTNLTRELELARDIHGLTIDQLRAAQRIAINASFAPDHVKRSVVAELG
jgi:adenosine deaminase